MRLRRFRPCAFRLDDRIAPANITWDGGASTLNWNDALNWSGDALPGVADDVTINATGTVTITFAGGTSTIKSLNLQDSLTLTAGSIAISGALTAPNVVINAKNGGTSLSAAGATTADGANIVAEAGGSISLPGLASYAGVTSKSNILEANGVGSKLSFANMTACNGSSSSVFYPRVRALAGGVIEMPAVTIINVGYVELKADGAGSQIDANSLASIALTSTFANLFATVGGTLNAPLLTQLTRANVTLDGTGSTPTNQLTQFNDANMTISGGIYGFPTLTTVSGGVAASGGANVTLGALTAFQGSNVGATFLDASGAGTTLSLPNLTTFKGSTFSVFFPHVRALAGGMVTIPLVTEITFGYCELKADGAGSKLDLPLLTKVDVAANPTASVFETKSATLHAPLLTLLGRTDLTLDGTGTWAPSQITRFLDGQITITGGTYSFTNMATFNGGVAASGGANVTLTALTAFQGSSVGTTLLDANGVGTKLNMPNLTSFKGSTSSVFFPRVRALAGGMVAVPLITEITSGYCELKTDGAGSILDLPVLSKVDIAANPTALVSETKGATLNAPVLTQFGRTNLTLDGTGTWAASQITQFLDAQISITGGTYSFTNMATFNGGVAVSGGANVTLGALTAFQGTTVGSTFLDANGVGTKLNMPNLTSFKGSTNSVFFPHVRALAGGVVTMPLVTEITFGNCELKAEGGGSTLDLPALTKIDIAAFPAASVSVTKSGSLNALLLTQFGRTDLTLDGTGVAPSSQMSQFLDGQITITGGSYTFPNLTNFNGGASVSGGAIVTLSAVTSYEASSAVQSFLQASGAGSQLNLSSITSFQGSGSGVFLPRLRALDGGLVNLPLVTEITSGYVELLADGTGAVLSAPLLSKITSPNIHFGYVTATDGGKVATSANLSIDRVELTRNPTGQLTLTSLNAGPGSMVIIEGAITADIIAAGNLDIRSGATAGSLSVTGNLTLAPTSTMRIDLGGLTAGTQYNQITVSGAVAVAGTLDLAYFNSFAPVLGNSFTIITGGSTTGYFSNHVDLYPGGTVELTPTYPANAVVLNTVPAAGPRIISQSPTGKITTPLTFFDMTFNEPMNAPTFTPGDVNLTGPSGTVTITSITQLSVSSFRINMAPQGRNGIYTLKVGPSIQDAAAFNMDQNTNGTKGENPADIYTGTLEVAIPYPKVSSLTINNGAAQRSRVTSLSVEFDTIVTLPAMPETAFQLKHNTNGMFVTLSANITNGSKTAAALSFVSSPLEFGSLADGRYTLTVFGASVTDGFGNQLDGNNDGLGGDNYVLVGSPTNGLFRLFGDADGDGVVAANDFIQFRLALGGSSAIFDFDNDGAVAASDFIQFRLRFGGSV